MELWYYTEGFREAGNTTPDTADDTFGIVDTDVGLALQPVGAAKASRNAIKGTNHDRSTQLSRN